MELVNESFTSQVKVGNTWGKQSLITNNGILSYEPTVLKEQSYASDGSFEGFEEQMMSVWFISSVNGYHESNNKSLEQIRSGISSEGFVIFYPNPLSRLLFLYRILHVQLLQL